MTLPRDLHEAVEESLDMMIRRWARKLWLIGDGEVRHLTESEVESMVKASRRATAGRFFRTSRKRSRR